MFTFVPTPPQSYTHRKNVLETNAKRFKRCAAKTALVFNFCRWNTKKTQRLCTRLLNYAKTITRKVLYVFAPTADNFFNREPQTNTHSHTTLSKKTHTRTHHKVDKGIEKQTGLAKVWSAAHVC